MTRAGYRAAAWVAREDGDADRATRWNRLAQGELASEMRKKDSSIVSEQLTAEWTSGFAVALAEMHRLSKASSVVCEVARNAGLTVKSARLARVSDFDLRELRAAGVAAK